MLISGRQSEEKQSWNMDDSRDLFWHLLYLCDHCVILVQLTLLHDNALYEQTSLLLIMTH